MAEHHMRVMWVALMIAAHEKVQNTDKIVKMALAHDITESRTGDVDYLSRQYTDRNEELAIDDMLVGSALEEEFVKLWRECEEKKSIEAKIVKDADNLTIDFELQEQKFMGVKSTEEKIILRKEVFPKKLFTKTAKRIWEDLYKTDPSDWHRNTRNRHKEGDWKIK